MTDDQINQRIADVCGWDEDCVLNTDGDRIWVTKFPLYCTDLNAMHEAEKSLPIKKILTYFKKLEKSSPYWFMAPARERAEAFLRTLGKWDKAE